MRLFSHILTTSAQLGTQILPKKQKRRCKLCKMNVYGFVLDKMQQISLTKFRSINSLLTKERVHQCINAITFKFVNKNGPFYLNEIFEFTPHCRIDTRNSFAKLKHPFLKTNTGQKTLSYIGPCLWNNLPKIIKKMNNLNTFKHNVKYLYVNQ